jgi:hypothetical protein
MSQQPPYDPRRPPRAARHRSSVQGPPPGTEPGTGYSPVQPPPTSPRYAYPRPPPRVPTPPTPNTPPFIPAVAHLGTSRNTAPRNVRPDPNIFDPIVEEDSFRPSQRSGRREVDPTRPPTVMFYPSTTTLSSLDTDDVVEPMPFFRTDLPLRTPTRGSNSTRQSLPATQEESRESYGRTVSVASSGVLGVGTIEVDPDTDTSSDDDSSMASSSFEQVMQEVSTVRRGQAQIVRNPSARKSVVPEVPISQCTEVDCRCAKHRRHLLLVLLQLLVVQSLLERILRQYRELRRRNRRLVLPEEHHGLRPHRPLSNFDDCHPLRCNPARCLASIALQVHQEVLSQKVLP